MVRIRFVSAVMISVALAGVASVGPAAAQPVARKSSVQKSPLLKEPTTPEEMFAATLLMVDFARMDLAVKYLEQFQATDPDDATLIKLRDKHGTADFLKLTFSKELQPAADELLEKLNAAAKRQAEDPAFVDSLINRLTRGPSERDMAISELRNIGATVVPEILRQMSKGEMVDHQDTLVIALTRMGKQVVPPLIGALDSPQERIRAAVIDSLGWLEAVEAIPYLWFPAFDEHQPQGVRTSAKKTLVKLFKGSPDRGTQLSSVVAANELNRMSRLLYRHPEAALVDEQGAVNLWAWSDSENTVAVQTLTPEIASLFLSTRFARQALALSPEQPETQRQYLASLLGLEVLRNGWDNPRGTAPGSAMYLGLTAGEETVSQVLIEALEASRPATAVAALEILGQIGTREQLLPQKGLKSPVLAAINSPDHRVQFAAAATVLKIEPKTGFTGANRVVAILARALTDPGQSRAIVIDTDSRRGTSTAGFLTDGGYEGVLTATGREGFEQAAMSAGIELVAVHVNSQRSDLTQTLANLRADSRTAALPIVIYGPSKLRGEMARLVARYSPATFVAESATSSDFLTQLVPFVKSLKTPPLSPQERISERNAAAWWLATIGSGPMSRVFEISQSENELSAAIDDPAVAANAMVALASIGTGSAQRRLSDIAINPEGTVSLRESAANQLAYHIQKFGLLLKQDQVVNVHSGWKSAENPVVKSALAGVIGSMKPDATIVGERLREFPVPRAN